MSQRRAQILPPGAAAQAWNSLPLPRVIFIHTHRRGRTLILGLTATGQGVNVCLTSFENNDLELGIMLNSSLVARSPQMGGFAALLILLAVAAPAQQTETRMMSEEEQVIAECGGDPEAGAPLFAMCSECHALRAEGPPKRGPHLEGILNRKVGAVEGYDYSPAMQLARASGKVWDREALRDYVMDPAAYLPGTSMGFVGIADEHELRNLMTYVNSASLAPPPEPGALELSAAVLALEGDAAYGEYLGGECQTCHQSDRAGQGIPQITDMPREAFVYAMHEYRLKARDNQAMQMIAGALNDEEIASLAAYFTKSAPDKVLGQ